MTTVYQHRRNDTNEIFYIGIGDFKRPYKKNNRNKYWNNIVDKVGYKVEIICDDVDWNTACQIEQYLIRFYGRKDKGFGSLVNMTDGGEGILGNKRNIQTKNLLSNKLIGNQNGKGNKGKPLTEEHRKKLSLAKLGKKSKKKDFTVSEETRKKISESLKGHIPWNKGKKIK